MYKYFADTVGEFLDKAITSVDVGANLLLIALLIFVGIMVAVSIVLFLIGKKVIKDQDTGNIS